MPTLKSVGIVFLYRREFQFSRNFSPALFLSPSLPCFPSSTTLHHRPQIFTIVHGFSARLSPAAATVPSSFSSVVAVLPEQVRRPLTTRSPRFLGLLSSDRSGLLAETDFGSDLVIGVIDTGIWPERRSFSDRDLGPVPAKEPSRELVVAEIEVHQSGERGEGGGDLAGDVVVGDVEDGEAGEAANVGGEGPGEAVADEVEDAEEGEGGDARRDGAGDLLPVCKDEGGEAIEAADLGGDVATVESAGNLSHRHLLG